MVVWLAFGGLAPRLQFDFDRDDGLFTVIVFLQTLLADIQVLLSPAWTRDTYQVHLQPLGRG